MNLLVFYLACKQLDFIQQLHKMKSIELHEMFHGVYSQPCLLLLLPLALNAGLIHSSRCSQAVKRMPNLNFNTPTLRSASHHMAKCQSCAPQQKKMMMMMLMIMLLVLDCRLLVLLLLLWLLPCGICRHRKKWQMAIPKQLLPLLQQQLVARRSRLSNCHCTDLKKCFKVASKRQQQQQQWQQQQLQLLHSLHCRQLGPTWGHWSSSCARQQTAGAAGGAGGAGGGGMNSELSTSILD